MKRRAGKYRKTYWVAGVAAALAVVGSGGCGRRESSPQPLMDTAESMWEDEITIMHVDAGDESFRAYIEELQTRLQMKINLLPYPANADSRHAKASSLLAAGDSSVDVFAVNDEMINAFKNEGYLEPLQDDVMDEETARAFEQEYLQETTMAGGQIYSAPYVLDILALWVNEEWMREAGLTGIETEEDFYRFLAHDWGEGRYAYGGSWEKTYVYNELGELINLFGGDYFDWSNEKTRAAVRFSKECVDKGYTPKEQMIDQHEQMNQKFIDGKYGMVFMYTGGIKKYAAAGVYGKDRIHMAPLPDLGGRHVTYIGTWQYALNKASQHKEAETVYELCSEPGRKQALCGDDKQYSGQKGSSGRGTAYYRLCRNQRAAAFGGDGGETDSGQFHGIYRDGGRTVPEIYAGRTGFGQLLRADAGACG